MNNSDNTVLAKKCGTITVNVFKTDDNATLFYLESNNQDVLTISDIIEDALKLY